MQIDWSKAPEGATHWEPAAGSVLSSWMRWDGNSWFYWPSTGSHSTPGWYQDCHMAPDRVARMIPRPGVWNGEGLPPVGTECDVLYTSLTGKYARVLVLAHDENRAVFRYLSGPSKGEYGSSYDEVIDHYPSFRPSPTPEQLARAAKIGELVERFALCDAVNVPWRDLFGQMFDAGVLK